MALPRCDVATLAGACFVLLASPVPAAVTEITTCGQNVESSSAVLVADMDCSGGLGGLVVAGTLDLAGHTFIGGSHLITARKVTSSVPGGTIIGTGGTFETQQSILARSIENVAMVDVALRDVGSISNVTLTNLRHWSHLRSIRISDSTIMGSGTLPGEVGIYASVRSTEGRIKLVRSNVFATDGYPIRFNAAGVVSTIGKLLVIDSTISGGGRPDDFLLFGARSVRVVRSTVEGSSGRGIGSGAESACSVRNSTVTGHAEAGLYCGVARLRATSAVGNGTDPECGVTMACADIKAFEGAHIDASSVCDRSYRMYSGIPGDDWDICTLD